MLTLEIELLTGVYRASEPDGSGAEWPPHPERVFSALVQAWGDGGMDGTERQALEWIEALDPPEIEASAACERDAPIVYVPPNDARGDKLEALPERRPRQARTFQAVVPEEPVIRLHWSSEPPAALRDALEALAQRVASVGHSASLVRCTVVEAARRYPAWRPDPSGRASLRVPYAGRLADLERWYSDDGGRKAVERPRSRRSVSYLEPSARVAEPAMRSIFGGVTDWFVFEESGGMRPDILAFGHVARRVRDALMKLGPQPTPEILSGHAPDGSRSEVPHVAIVPLANVGWPHSSGELLGFAIVLPRACSAHDRAAVIQALGAFAGEGEEVARAQLQLTQAHRWALEHARHPSRASLRPGRWCGRGRTWSSATPVVLDRFPHDDVLDEARCVAAACRNIGLPEPVEIELHKNPAVAGAPPTYPQRGPRGATWSFPAGSRFADRPRRHVVIRFADEVEGPVILGAGRYHGFGLCLPINEERSP